MKISFSLLALAMLAGCVEITRPAENNLQNMVFINTPTYDNVEELSTTELQLEMISALLPTVAVGLVTNSHSEYVQYRHDLLYDYNVSSTNINNLVEFEVPHTDVWVRDMGPIIVNYEVDGVFTTEQLQGYPSEGQAVLNFEFDGWGYEQFIALGYYDLDDDFAPAMAELLDLPVIDSPLIMEGGNFNSNGVGTIAYSYYAAQQRQPSWTKAQIEHELAKVTGAQKLLAPPFTHPFDGHSVLDGPLEMNGVYYHLAATVNHIDEVQQFVNATTMVVATLPQSDVTNALEQRVHDALAANEAYFRAATDQNGNPFTVHTLPDPGFIVEEMDEDDIIWQWLGSLSGIQHYDPAGGFIVSPASYMNYVVSNDVLLIPQFYKPGRPLNLIDKDAEAVATLSSLYPGHTVYTFDTDTINFGGGGMHCITQEWTAL